MGKVNNGTGGAACGAREAGQSLEYAGGKESYDRRGTGPPGAQAGRFPVNDTEFDLTGCALFKRDAHDETNRSPG